MYISSCKETGGSSKPNAHKKLLIDTMYLVNAILHFAARFAHVGKHKTPTTKEMSIAMIEVDKEMKKVHK